MAGTLILRADATSAMGAGHVLRSLALAQAWQADGGEAIFLSHCPAEALRRRVAAAGVGFVPLDEPHPATTDLAALLALVEMAAHGRLSLRDCRLSLRESSAAFAERKATMADTPIWVAMDGYHFDPEYQAAVRATGARLLVIDDLAHLERYEADVLLNQNLGREATRYPCPAETACLVGCRWALLRPEFAAWETFQRETPAIARRLLVTTGGADPANLTERILAALRRPDLAGLEARVVVGPANPHRASLAASAVGAGHVDLLHDVTDMSRLMAWADMAVSAAGGTAWELGYMRLPAILTVLADNQQTTAARLAEAGAAVNLGRADALTPDAIADAIQSLRHDPDRRASQARAGRRLIDGQGARRVVGILRAIAARSAGAAARLRPAAADDLLPLWRLANDPTVRSNSLTTAAIELESHRAWFQEKLADPAVRIWVLDLDGFVAGVIRYDAVDAETAAVSIHVASALRRQGLAARLLAETGQAARTALHVRRFRAIILEDNAASLGIFRRAGFVEVESRTIKGRACVILESRTADV